MKGSITVFSKSGTGRIYKLPLCRRPSPRASTTPGKISLKLHIKQSKNSRVAQQIQDKMTAKILFKLFLKRAHPSLLKIKNQYLIPVTNIRILTWSIRFYLTPRFSRKIAFSFRFAAA
jgi:hypothetical protein